MEQLALEFIPFLCETLLYVRMEHQNSWLFDNGVFHAVSGFYIGLVFLT